jgi:hypothetical protein
VDRPGPEHDRHLFLALDSLGKLVQAAPVLAGTAQLGYPVSAVLPLGIALAVCVAAYAIPRTSVLGAVLLTGYLGGAIATHVRVENPLFTHTHFPIYVAAFVWGGIFLREPRALSFLAGSRLTGTAESTDTRRKPCIPLRDGTRIAYERSGKGPALILVDGALCSRAFGPMPKLAPFLAPHTVFV